MHAEETVRRELLLQLRKRDGRKEAVSIRVDAGVVVLRLDVANLVHGDEHLAAALLHGDALLRGVARGRGLHDGLHLVERAVEPVGLNGLHEIVDGVHVERLERVFAVRGHKHHRRRVLQLVQGFGKLHARRLRHRDVQKYHVDALVGTLLALDEGFHGLAGVQRLANGVDASRLLKEVP